MNAMLHAQVHHHDRGNKLKSNHVPHFSYSEFQIIVKLQQEAYSYDLRDRSSSAFIALSKRVVDAVSS